MLTAGGLTEDDLGCPPDWPGDSAARDELVREHGGKRPHPDELLRQARRHAARLRRERLADRGYLDPAAPAAAAHPRRRWSGSPASRSRDGDRRLRRPGVRDHAASGLARALHRIGTASDGSPFALHRVAGRWCARCARPVDDRGPGRPDTIAIERLGVFAKRGAEGVMVMVAPNGTTVALKMLDGSGRAATIVAATLLARAGALTDAEVSDLAAALPLAVLGGGSDVGAIRPAAGI